MKKELEGIYRYIKDNKLIEKEDVVLVAVSGGADSMALLYILQIFKADLDIELCVCHVHHGIRGEEADGDANYVKEYCTKNNLEYREYKEDIINLAKEKSLSLEEAGRLRRYEIFDSLSGELEKEKGRKVKIAVAHNKNDNAETIIMNLCRGTGLKGLSGIKLNRKNIIRPLLYTDRSKIEEILKDAKISYRVDSTNLGDDYKRNIIRHKILPVLQEDINNASVENIVKSSKFINMADEFIDEKAREISKEIFIYRNTGLVGFKFEKLKKEKKILRTYFIRIFIKEILNKLKDIEAVHIDMLDNLIFMETGKSINFPYKLRFYKTYDSILLDRGDADNKKEKDLKEDFELRVFENKNFKIDDLIYTKYVDYAKIEKVLSFRTRETGDYIYIKAGKKSIKSFMIDEKIEAKDRNKIPLVAMGKDIIWIVGKRLSEAYKVDDSTKRILEIKYKRGF